MNEIDLNKAMQTSGVFLYTVVSQREYLRLLLTQDDNEAGFSYFCLDELKSQAKHSQTLQFKYCLSIDISQSHSPVNYRKQINCKLFCVHICAFGEPSNF